MTDKEEKYVHFAICLDSLNNSWLLFNTIQNNKNNCLVGAAFRYALIEYSKPYVLSYGSKSSTGKQAKYKIDSKYIPQNYLHLHYKLLKARNQIHAHTDLSILEVKLFIQKIRNRKIVSRSQNAISILDNIENIDIIIDLIEKTLDNMYKDIDTMESELDFSK